MNLLEKALYSLVYFIFWVFSFIPLKVLFLISEFFTFLTFRLIQYRRKVVVENLTNSFPELSSKEIKHLAYKYFRHMSVMIVENVFLRFVSPATFKNKLNVGNTQLFETLYKQQKNVIVMVGHFGNWEYGSGLTKYIPYKGVAVYKKLSSKVFDKIYYDIRKRLGVEPIEMSEVFRKVVAMNNQDEPFLLFMVADQSPMKNDNQHWLTFLNQQTGAYIGSEKLAKRFNCAVVYMELLRIKKGSYGCKYTLICDDAKQTQDHEITERFFSLLEQSIKTSPRYWLWSHRRWKHKPDKAA